MPPLELCELHDGSMMGLLRRWFTSLLLHKSLVQLLASAGVLLLVSYALEQRYNTLNVALLSTIAGVCANFFVALVSSPSAVICGPVAILSCHLGEHLIPALLWHTKSTTFWN